MIITEVRERLAGREMVWWAKALAVKTDDLSLSPGFHLALPSELAQRGAAPPVGKRVCTHTCIPTHARSHYNCFKFKDQQK